jgi:hypothetical protein
VPLALYDLAYNLGIARRLLPALPLAARPRPTRASATPWNATSSASLEAAMRSAPEAISAAARRFAARPGPRASGGLDAS